MCSICGMIDYEGGADLNEIIVEKMSKTMVHRGPDDTGIIKTSFAVFAHNRLAVMDPQNGKQPMTLCIDGYKYTIIYNGEVYNFKELRQDLEKRGIIFQTDCDTEVVLYTYIVYKEKCAELLNGIYAFAIVDEKEKRVFLARDRFGVKPFFYCFCGTTLLIASEIKALLAHPNVKPSLNKEGLWQLLFLSPATVSGSGVFEDIMELEPATAGYFDKSGLRLFKYWRLIPKDVNVSAVEAAEETNRILTDAINRQLVSDVPLAVLLSGGLDSSIVSAVAAEAYKNNNRKISTYSFEYENNKQNFKSSLFQPQGDDEYAAWLAEWLGTKHTVLTAPTEAVCSLLAEAVKARDIPGQADIDSSLLYFCREIKKEHTVVLSGECADEIFGGYPWFYRKEMLENGFFPWIHQPFARSDLFRADAVDSKNGFDYISQIYKNSLESCPLTGEESENMKTSRIACWLSVNWFMASLLERKDRMSMYSGLEVRVPFSDHRILEYVYNIPWEIKFENNVEKALLRNAMKTYLPDKILHRKKSPYPKTFDPEFERKVTDMLVKRLVKGSPLSELIDMKSWEDFINGENVTWFGQLMSRPQLIAWLLQFDFWLEHYNVDILM